MIATEAGRLGGALRKGVNAQVDAWYHGTRSERINSFFVCFFCFGRYCYLGNGWKYPFLSHSYMRRRVCRHSMHSEHLAGISWLTFPCVFTYAARQESRGLLYFHPPLSKDDAFLKHSFGLDLGNEESMKLKCFCCCWAVNDPV